MPLFAVHQYADIASLLAVMFLLQAVQRVEEAIQVVRVERFYTKHRPIVRW